MELFKLAIPIKEKIAGVKRRKYDASFKEEVLKMVLNGHPVNEVAQSLGIGENLIYRWKSRSKKQQSTASTGNIVAVALQVEDQQALPKRIRELETERDILKRALAIFSRQI